MTDAYGNDAATSTGTIADTTNDAASGAPQRAESAERLARPLVKLAKACGLSTSFIDQLGTYTEISDDAFRYFHRQYPSSAILKATTHSFPLRYNYR